MIYLAMVHDISLKNSVHKGVSKSWVVQPKGILQVNWERGIIELDRFCMKDFTEKGKLDGIRNIISNTSISQLLYQVLKYF